jgi:hypothetical protein
MMAALVPWGHDRLHVKRRVYGDGSYVLQLGLPVHTIFDDLVDRSGLDAMRGCQHQFRRDQNTAAEITARADNRDNRTTDTFGRRHSTADNRTGR